MAWTKLRPLEEPVRSGCGYCVDKPKTLPMNWLLIFYGSCQLTKDGKGVWDMPFGPPEVDKYEKRPWSLRNLENIAAKDPNHDWRLEISTPLWDGVWQRQGIKKWLAVKKGMGFA